MRWSTDVERRAVDRGVELLDQVDPGWWRRDNPRPIYIDNLDISDDWWCICGQRGAAESGDRYLDGLRHLGVDEPLAGRYGFTAIRDRTTFAGLTAGWREVIRDRRAEELKTQARELIRSEGAEVPS